MEERKKRIAIMTSGGDAPGMNAVIYGIYARAAECGYEVWGIMDGYAGLLKRDIFPMRKEMVNHIISQGGTILRTARCEEFKNVEVQVYAADICREYKIDVVIVIGGDGSFAGALKLSMQGIGVIGIPGTIDLDIGCTDYTIGFDTAVNTSIEAIDRISDTCKSHSCFCVVEVMGRRAGFIALWSGIGNAAQVIWADNHMTLEKITHYLKEKNITSGVIVMAEGVGKAERVATYIEEKIHVHTRANVLAFIQRGGSPTGKDRVVGCMMGSYAVDLFTEGKIQHLVCIKKDELSAVTIKEGLQMEKKDPVYLYNLSKTVMKL